MKNATAQQVSGAADGRESAKRRSKLVTLQQASAETGVPYASLRDLVIAGHLQRVQLGDSTRIWIRRADLDRLIG
jgi:hypothetical protein